MGKIYYVMGKSSSGKDTIYKCLRERHPEHRAVVPYTTRPIREGERDGEEYFFVTEEEMDRLKDSGKIIELRSYNTQCGVWNYFTVDDGQINTESYDYLMIGTLESYSALKKYFGAGRIIPVYVEVEDGVRLERALKRERCQENPKYSEMCRRFLADEKDFSEENLRQAGIVKRFENDDLEMCLAEIERYMKV